MHGLKAAAMAAGPEELGVRREQRTGIGDMPNTTGCGDRSLLASFRGLIGLAWVSLAVGNTGELLPAGRPLHTRGSVLSAKDTLVPEERCWVVAVACTLGALAWRCAATGRLWCGDGGLVRLELRRSNSLTSARTAGAGGALLALSTECPRHALVGVERGVVERPPTACEVTADALQGPPVRGLGGADPVPATTCGCTAAEGHWVVLCSKSRLGCVGGVSSGPRMLGSTKEEVDSLLDPRTSLVGAAAEQPVAGTWLLQASCCRSSSFWASRHRTCSRNLSFSAFSSIFSTRIKPVDAPSSMATAAAGNQPTASSPPSLRPPHHPDS